MKNAEKIVKIREQDTTEAFGLSGAKKEGSVSQIQTKGKSDDKLTSGEAVLTHTSEVSEYERYKFAYQALLQIRDVDNKLMWTRANIALILQGGLLAFAAPSITNLTSHNRPIAIFICLFGLMISTFWFMLTKGGFFWIKFWQAKMGEIEPHLFGDSVRIFRKHPHNEPENMEAFKSSGYVSTNNSIKLITVSTVIFWLIILGFLIRSFFIVLPA